MLKIVFSKGFRRWRWVWLRGSGGVRHLHHGVRGELRQHPAGGLPGAGGQQCQHPHPVSVTWRHPQDFLRRFSRYNFAGHCLGLLFTNRLFKDLVLGTQLLPHLGAEANVYIISPNLSISRPGSCSDQVWRGVATPRPGEWGARARSAPGADTWPRG